MRDRKSISWLVLSSTLAISTLSGCVQPPKASCDFRQIDEAQSVTREIVVVIAPNMGFLDFENVIADATPKVQEIFDEKKNASFTIVLADGNPEILSSSLINVEKLGTFQADVDEEVQNAMRELDKAYRCALGLDGISIGATDESDVTKALQKAVDAFRDADSQREIFVLANGISTAGQVNFVTDGLPKLDSYTENVDKYGAQNALVNLKGSSITWVGLGQTDNTHQKQLGTQSDKALVEFWKLFIEKSNGVVKSIESGSVVSGEPNSKSLEVTPVLPNDQKACINETLDESQGFYFKPNTAIFINDILARRGAEEIAGKILEKNCAGTITVTGYVASGTDKATFDANPDAGQNLSLQRAEAFKQLLVSAGITNQEVVSKGGGHGEVDDWDSDGNFDEDLGKKNRIVKITQ
jgi:hypothetical protein